MQFWTTFKKSLVSHNVLRKHLYIHLVEIYPLSIAKYFNVIGYRTHYLSGDR